LLNKQPTDFLLQITYKSDNLGANMFAWLMNLFSKIFGNTAKTNVEKNKDGNSLSEGNWLGPDGIETGSLRISQIIL